MHYAYPNGTTAIRGISLEVPPGERIALLGENGSGKTTLARLLVGILKPSEGSIRLGDMEYAQQTTHRIAREVGLVFQNPDHQIFLDRVWDEVAYGPRNYGLAASDLEDRVGKELRAFDLWQDRYRLPAALSGGERKSVAFASSFAIRPRVLLLDEPTKGMDDGRKRRLMHMAEGLAAEGRTVIFITHDVDFAYEATKRTVVLRRGRVVLDGRTKDVLSGPGLAQVGLHVATVPRLLATLREGGIAPDTALYREVLDEVEPTS